MKEVCFTGQICGVTFGQTTVKFAAENWIWEKSKFSAYPRADLPPGARNQDTDIGEFVLTYRCANKNIRLRFSNVIKHEFSAFITQINEGYEEHFEEIQRGRARAMGRPFKREIIMRLPEAFFRKNEIN